MNKKNIGYRKPKTGIIGFLHMFKCDPFELMGFALISAFAYSLFIVLILLVDSIGFYKIPHSCAIVAGMLVGCAFMLSSKDRTIERLETDIRLLKENR